MKRKIAFLLTLVVILTSCLAVSAARSLNSYEQEIISSLKSGITVDGKTVSIPASYINQAETYLQGRDEALTETEAAKINAQITETKTVIANEMKETGVYDLNKLSKDVKGQAVENAKEAAAVIDLKLEYNSSTDVVKIIDSEGNVVFEDSAPIKATGADFVSTISIASVIALTLAGAFVFVKKNKVNA